jgi:hypothetical protein
MKEKSMKYFKYFLFVTFASAVAAFAIYFATSSDEVIRVFFPLEGESVIEGRS